MRTTDGTTLRERGLHEAFWHGCAMLCLGIGATMLVVGMLMLLCGVTFRTDDAWWFVGPLLLAGALALRARLARRP